MNLSATVPVKTVSPALGATGGRMSSTGPEPAVVSMTVIPLARASFNSLAMAGI